MNMLIAMAVTAALCIGIGVYPDPLYAILPFPVDYVPYTGSHVLTQLQLLVFSALAFSVLMRTGIYPPEMRLVNLDSDWTYRRLAPAVLKAAGSVIGAADSRLRLAFLSLLRRGLDGIKAHYGPDSVAARSWNTSLMVLCAIAGLGLYLAFLFA